MQSTVKTKYPAQVSSVKYCTKSSKKHFLVQEESEYISLSTIEVLSVPFHSYGIWLHL